MDDRIRVAKEDGLSTVTLASPERLNAFDDAMIAAFDEACAALAADEAVRAIMITGVGRAFCAGVDLKWVVQQNQAIQQSARGVITHLHGAISTLRRAPKPVITAVNGVAAGAGIGLALSGDIVLASNDARFSLAYSKVGLAPDGGTTYFLPRLVGEKRALSLFLSGEAITAADAQVMGLITRVLAAGEFVEEAQASAAEFARGPTLAYALTKQLVSDSLREGLESQMEKERHAITRTFASEDFSRGVSAFFAKKTPAFAGR